MEFIILHHRKPTGWLLGGRSSNPGDGYETTGFRMFLNTHQSMESFDSSPTPLRSFRLNL